MFAEVFKLDFALTGVSARDQTLTRDFSPTVTTTIRHGIGGFNVFTTNRRDLSASIAKDFARSLEHVRELVVALVGRINADSIQVRKSDQAIIRKLTRIASQWSTLWLQYYIHASFGPDLQSSWPRLGLFPMVGYIGNSELTEPVGCCFEFESDQRTTSIADRGAAKPDRLVADGYDLCFPLISVPIGNLRRNCPEWRTNRSTPILGTLPFIFPSFRKTDQFYPTPPQEMFSVPRIFALLPKQELWRKPFEEWTAEDWADRTHFSLLWDITTGKVLIAQGVRHVDEMYRVGKTFEDFVKSIEADNASGTE